MSKGQGEKRIILALFQGKAENGEVQSNMEKMKTQLRRAASAGAEIIVFPELFLSGYCVPGEEMKMLAEERDGPSFQALSKTARESKIAVLYGYPEVDRSNGALVYYNSAQLIDRDGTSLVNYRKTHLWIPSKPPLYEALFTPGSQFQDPVECCGMSIGILICFDIEFSEPARSLTLSGANLIAVPTASTLEVDGQACKFTVRTRAWDNGVYVAYVNHMGDGMEGCSQLCDPNGTVVVCSGREETLLLGSVILPVRSKINYIGSRRPELYGNLC